MNSGNPLYFLMGIGVGIVAAILYAPKSGAATRDFLKSKSEEGASYVRQTASDAIDTATQKADALKKTAARTIDQMSRSATPPMES